MMDGYGMHGWGMGWWWIIGIIIIVAIILMMVKATNKNSNIYPTSDKSALDILKERYARGEIGKEEFEEKRRTLDI